MVQAVCFGRNKGRPRGFTLIELMIVVGITGIIIAVVAPTYLRQRLITQQRSCQENLTKIDGAKNQWALENHKGSFDVPNLSDLYTEDRFGYLKNEPQCPAKGNYTFGMVTERAVCSLTEPLDHNAEL